MKNKFLKICSIIIISFMLFVMGTTYVSAENVEENETGITSWTPNWSALDGQSAPDTENVIYTIAGRIINIISIVGICIALITLLIIGIKYIIGSPDAQAEYKKTFSNYVIGCVILFGASTILGIVQMFITGLSDSVVETSACLIIDKLIKLI